MLLLPEKWEVSALFIAYHTHETVSFHLWDTPTRYDVQRKLNGVLLGSFGVILH